MMRVQLLGGTTLRTLEITMYSTNIKQEPMLMNSVSESWTMGSSI